MVATPDVCHFQAEIEQSAGIYPATKPPPPAPKPRKQRVTITEVMKLHLLQLYIKKAPNPCLRDKGEGRAAARKQLLEIQASGFTMEDKDKTSLDGMDIDNLAKIFAFNGLKEQPKGQGLLAIVDKHFEGREMTTEQVRSEVSAIMTLAASIKTGAQQ